MANYPLPPTLQGNQVQQLADVRRYLFRLVEQLNTSAEQLGSAQTGGNGSAAMSAAGGTAGGKTELNAAQEELKTLIIKTANTVRHEMDALTARLESEYVAQSEFGTFRETVANDITASAMGWNRASRRTARSWTTISPPPTAISGRAWWDMSGWPL